MSDYAHYVIHRNADQQIAERVQRAERLRVPGGRRRWTGRHALASRLHHLADRIDG